METKKFDVVVIGGGPGGYPAAIKAAQGGKSVALVEAKELGGTCLNRGCIPSKALISDARNFRECLDSISQGLLTGHINFDFTQMSKRKDEVVKHIRKNLVGLIAANNITVFKGVGTLVSPQEVKVTGTDSALLQAKNIIIASGSEPRTISAFPFDYQRIHDSTSLLALDKAPKSIVIIGGGVIGCEFASLYSNLGCDVTVIELMPRLLPMEDVRISEALEKIYKKRGVKVLTEANVKSIETTKKGVRVLLESGEKQEAEIALVSVGRSLNTSKIGLEKAGVLVDDKGLVIVDEKMETTQPGIYAVGDIASKWWLAHVATHQGIVAASNIIGKPMRMEYRAIPSVIFTSPEIATVGFTLENALKAGYKAVLASFPFQALGKAHAIRHPDGFGQIVFDQQTGEILGAQVVGEEAANLIAEMTAAIANELTIECIAETIHAHPTLSEVWVEAAHLGLGWPIHLPSKGKKHA